MHTHSILESVEVRVVAAPVAAASNTDNNSSRIDMQGYESVTFIASITASVATGVATLKIEENDIDSDTGMAAPALGAISATKTAVGTELADTALVVESYHPGKRYVQAVRTSTTANITFGHVIALLRPRQLPVTAHVTVVASARDAN